MYVISPCMMLTMAWLLVASKELRVSVARYDTYSENAESSRPLSPALRRVGEHTGRCHLASCSEIANTYNL